MLRGILMLGWKLVRELVLTLGMVRTIVLLVIASRGRVRRAKTVVVVVVLVVV
jgi:hypothetical protein